MNKKKKYILGYPHEVDYIPNNLVLYLDEAQADYESEEWCEVFATSLKKAKQNYEQAFAKRQKK